MKRLRNCARASWELFRNRYLCFAFRLVLGATLVASGVGKLPELAGFVDEVAEYDILPDSLVGAYGAALPWVEIVIGALLILGLFLRFASGISILTSLSLVIANSVVLYRGLNLECGCFGDLAVLQTRDSLVIDCVLLIMAFQILAHKREFLSLDSLLFRRKRRDPPLG